MKLRLSLLAAAGLALAASLGAQTTTTGLKKIAISDVRPIGALVESVTRAGRKNSLDRVVQSMDSQLMDRVQNTRKFEVIARSDMSSILKEADFSGGAFQVSGVDYLLVTTLGDFQDYAETREFAALGKSASWRVIRLAVVGKIYDGTTGKLIESANIPVELREQTENGANSTKNGDLSDSLLQEATFKAADLVAARVADVIYPARIVSKIDRKVTISRGEGSGVEVGQRWVVFALGEEMIDPDTGASLGREELKVGQVRITRVNPKTSQAEIIDDDGIDKGALLRLPVGAGH
ncbi:MAG: hypothetical protein IPL39_12405 [Opitutaceae bacterium]|nr:hypothetical protein [Opitutaceae bacterium]